MLKRAEAGYLGPPPKKRAKREKITDVSVAEGVATIQELVEPYKLVTAKFPIDSLSYRWGVGSNRKINKAHVKCLRGIFEEQGLQWQPAKNRLKLACSEREAQKMMDHLGTEGESREWLSFLDWDEVVGTKVELMAGQHRAEALREMHGEAESTEPAWAYCDVYDIGRPRRLVSSFLFLRSIRRQTPEPA